MSSATDESQPPQTSDLKRARMSKLFTLHRQKLGNTGPDPRMAALGKERHLSETQAQAIMDRASKSLATLTPAKARGLRARLVQKLLPRNPVATTNFSDESDRLAGGLTLTTLSNRCFNSN